MKRIKTFISLILCFAFCSIFFSYGATGSDAYEISSQDVKSFKKGETVAVTFKVDNIKPESGILGFDINLKLNKDYVTTPIVNDDIEKANASNTTISALNTNGGKWTISGRMDNKDDSVLIITILEDNAVDAVMPGKSFEFTLAFTAAKDSEPGVEIISTSEAAGTNGNIETITGRGTSVKIAGEAPSKEPDVKPTATSAPTSAPTKTPDKPNPTTFDLGILSLAAMGLTSLTVVNKKFKK